MSNRVLLPAALPEGSGVPNDLSNAADSTRARNVAEATRVADLLAAASAAGVARLDAEVLLQRLTQRSRAQLVAFDDALIDAGDAQEGVGANALRIAFNVERDHKRAPNNAEVAIWNLSRGQREARHGDGRTVGLYQMLGVLLPLLKRSK